MERRQQGPLSGLVVVDLTRALAGPYCTMLLADLGASVIKVEPLTGDRLRRQGPFAPDDELRDFGGYVQSVNRNKEGIAVDLFSPAGIEVVRRLAANADVIVENFRRGVMEEMGLSYESLSAANPKLVYGAVSGFGDPRTGVSPYAERPAYDVLVQAMAGIMQITGHKDGPPTKVGPGVGDIFPGTLLAVGLLAAVIEAQRTGVGRFVDVAMYDAMLSLAERTVYQYSYTDQVPGRDGNDHPLYAPVGIYRAADGWVSISATTERQWAALCTAMGRPELINDPDLSSAAARGRQKERLRTLIEEWTLKHPKQAIAERLADELPAGPVNNIADIVSDPHVAARHMVIDLDHPGSSRRVQVAGEPIKVLGYDTSAARRAPLLGEDTRAVLSRYFAPDELEALFRDGIVAGPREHSRSEQAGAGAR